MVFNTLAGSSIISKKPVYWTYVTGEEVVAKWGCAFKVNLVRNNHYVVIIETSGKPENAIASSVRVYENRYETRTLWNYGTFADSYHRLVDHANIATTVAGKQCLLIRYKTPYTPLVFDINECKLFILCPPVVRECAECRKAVEEVEKHFGDLSSIYGDMHFDVDWKPLEKCPAGEYAGFCNVDYVVVSGDIARQYFGAYFTKTQYEDDVDYLIYRTHLDNGLFRFHLCINKWQLDEKAKNEESGINFKIPSEFKQTNSARKYIRSFKYKNAPARIGSKPVIITYPFNEFTPAVWDITTNTVMTFPSKMHRGNSYIDELKSVFGEQLPIG